MQLNSSNYIQQWDFWRETGMQFHKRMVCIEKYVLAWFYDSMYQVL